eukprot:CAMPEP_0202743468 /NCGR_PEP_ID=MMETSP1388-20130828/5833_1 /ASSEMBLY_ACC=CAM_ASM_000864 /TAXON_ID=37098 /ORGANISM="Isochrysis sp, Strain CCMP1244" /LENGTH=64 /DNA_ID=CAMNT_0049410495 /DNA_START=113 /DNA_END=303 /DNA_ORIENTATION=-
MITDLVAAVRRPVGYSKATPGEARALPIGATASHTSSAGSYRSTELMPSSLWPPTAYSLPSSTA